MWGMDYTTLQVGDEVAVARSGSWMVHSEGIYTVVKVDKLKVVVRRKSDNYERVFSVKRRCEMGKENSYRSAYLEPVADMEARDRKMARERDIRRAWQEAEQAGRDKDIVALRDALMQLEKLGQ